MNKINYLYQAYGLEIEANLKIPEFPEIIAKATTKKIKINFQTNSNLEAHIPSEVIPETMAIKTEGDTAVLYLREIGVFVIRAGVEITVIPHNRASLAKIRQVLVGKVMAILLCQRGLLVLHGSGVKVGNSVVLLLADSGEGKSTFVAALHRRGHDLVTDDVAAIDLNNNCLKTPVISPTFPQIKLTNITGEILGCQSLGKLDSSVNKYWYSCDIPNSQKPLPVGAIYLLKTGSTLQIKPVPPQTALTALMRHSSHNLWFHQQETELFRQCSSLAKQVAVYRLQRPRDLSLLPKLAMVIEEHFMNQQVANQQNQTGTKFNQSPLT